MIHIRMIAAERKFDRFAALKAGEGGSRNINFLASQTAYQFKYYLVRLTVDDVLALKRNQAICVTCSSNSDSCGKNHVRSKNVA